MAKNLEMQFRYKFGILTVSEDQFRMVRDYIKSSRQPSSLAILSWLRDVTDGQIPFIPREDRGTHPVLRAALQELYTAIGIIPEDWIPSMDEVQ